MQPANDACRFLHKVAFVCFFLNLGTESKNIRESPMFDIPQRPAKFGDLCPHTIQNIWPVPGYSKIPTHDVNVSPVSQRQRAV